MKTIYVESYTYNFKLLELQSCFKLEIFDWLTICESQNNTEGITHTTLDGYGLLIIIINQ